MEDIAGIQNIHRDCEDPWHDFDECRAWVEKRIERNFYIQVALVCDKIVGHGEWIVSNEPAETFLYLGMLQIDSEYKGQGIGRRMIEDGTRYAKENSCTRIVTIPETDDSTILFYEKCGFVKGEKIFSTKLPVIRHNDNFSCVNSVPEEIISEKRFVFGLAQISSRHMYECLNQKPLTDDRLAPAIKCDDGSLIQLSCFEGNETALALCWSNNPAKKIIESALKLGYSYGLKTIEFICFERDKALFDNAVFEESGIEIYIKI
jgi:GNAT superfamily N-acetyltransferase